MWPILQYLKVIEEVFFLLRAEGILFFFYLRKHIPSLFEESH